MPLYAVESHVPASGHASILCICEGHSPVIDLSDIQTTLQDVEGATKHVEAATKKVEKAVVACRRAIEESRQWSTSSFVMVGFCVALLIWMFDTARYSKTRYVLESSVSYDQVETEKKPHDCDILAAPLGLKYCHYDSKVVTAYRKRSGTGEPLVSFDDGRTWEPFTPKPGDVVTTDKSLGMVFVGWDKVTE
jgi:hypothetical protein